MLRAMGQGQHCALSGNSEPDRRPLSHEKCGLRGHFGSRTGTTGHTEPLPVVQDTWGFYLGSQLTSSLLPRFGKNVLAGRISYSSER